ncbi:MAG: hypothetical protein MJZ74_07920 [Muribaculaceae bacterium]|nr:hypothetical protein [Muribaculaceae bacterium]
MYPKFIITSSGQLRLGLVNLHKNLLEPGEECHGGGYYKFDYEHATLELSGESSDYGPPQWSGMGTLLVPMEYRDLEIVYFPGSRSGYAVKLDDILTIEYI